MPRCAARTCIVDMLQRDFAGRGWALALGGFESVAEIPGWRECGASNACFSRADATARGARIDSSAGSDPAGRRRRELLGFLERLQRVLDRRRRVVAFVPTRAALCRGAPTRHLYNRRARIRSAGARTLERLLEHADDGLDEAIGQRETREMRSAFSFLGSTARMSGKCSRPLPAD